MAQDNAASAPSERSGGSWPRLLAEYRWLRTVVRARVGEPQAVDDLLQEVALAVAKQDAWPRDPAKVAPWLYRIAVRQCLLYRRRAGRQRRLVQRYANRRAATVREPDPLHWLLGRERDETLRRILQELPDRDREMLMLKHVEGWSYPQIAEQLGVSRHAVEYRLLKARRRLRTRLAHRQLLEVP